MFELRKRWHGLVTRVIPVCKETFITFTTGVFSYMKCLLHLVR